MPEPVVSEARPQPTMPMVTVVIPCHNHARWVNEAIDSVAKQDYERRQLVVIDDGSSDGSAETVLRRLHQPSKTDQNVYVGNLDGGSVKLMLAAYKPASGPAAARNQGIRLAWNYTDLFGFLDSDDLYEQGKLSKSIAVWLKDPTRIGAVYSDFDTLSVTTGLRLRHFKEPFSRERLVQECIVNNDSIVSKAALEACGVYDEEMRTCEDYDLWMRVSERYIISHLPESLVTIRVGNHSSSSTVQKDVWEKNWRRVFEKAQARLS